MIIITYFFKGCQEASFLTANRQLFPIFGRQRATCDLKFGYEPSFGPGNADTYWDGGEMKTET